MTLLRPVGVEPCGFCGLDGCRTQLTIKKGGTTSITSSCPYHYSTMSYKAARNVSKGSPCTNVPIHCPLCPPAVSGDPRTIWKYNTIFHLLSEHSSEDTGPPAIPPELMIEMFVTKKEEGFMGVDGKATDEWRGENSVPNSDAVEAMKVEVSQKRGRTNTVNSESATQGAKRARGGETGAEID